MPLEDYEQLTAEDREDLRDAKVFIEYEGSPIWKVLEKRLLRALAMREEIVRMPLHTIPEAVIPNGDFVTRASALEHIKGAMIGLRTALELPRRIVDARAQILAQHAEVEDDDT